MLWQLLRREVGRKAASGSTRAQDPQHPQVADVAPAGPPVADWPYHLHREFERLRIEWLEQHGAVVQAGPFAGMRYHERSIEGCYLPKVMGTYEAELFALLRSLPQRGYRRIVNIGCADGYYAVGLARLLREATVWACDIDPRAIAATSALARANGVEARVRVEEYLFRPQDFAARAGPATLVVMDIEGAEEELLDEIAIGGLAQSDLLVEVHDCYRPGLSALLGERFSASHAVECLRRRDMSLQMPEASAQWGDLDRALAVCEWRVGPTPWLWAQSRHQSM